MERQLASRPVGPPTTELANLDPERLECLDSLISTILASKVAENTFAQIIDGLPTRLSFEKNTGTTPLRNAVLKRDMPTDQSLTTFKDFRSRFQPSCLQVNLRAVQAYQTAPRQSDQFYVRLLEVAALAIHALGNIVYNASHPNTDVYPQEYDCSQHPHYPVDLYHKLYLGYSIYPYGILDIVGYWAETQIFGGVLLLKHDRSENQVLGVFIHPPSYNAFQLSHQQLERIARICERGQDMTAITQAFLPFEAESEIVLSCNDFYGACVFRDEFSRIYPQKIFAPQSCVVPMTDDMRFLMNRVKEQLEFETG